MRALLRRRTLLLAALVAPTLLVPPGEAASSSSRLDPVSISFSSSRVGHVLSLVDCAGSTCAALRATTDAGTTWSVIPLPPQLDASLRLAPWGTYGTTYATLSVHFADARDGWIYGTVPAPVTPTTGSPNWVGRLWSTHDGGTVWREVRLGPLAISAGVVQMATHRATTYLFGWSDQTGRASILAAPSTSDHWTEAATTPLATPAGGSPLEGSFTFAGTNGWFVEGNDRGFLASARLESNGTWGAWSVRPLEALGVSASPVTAVTHRLLLAQCASAGLVLPPASTAPPGWDNGASWLFISYDGGGTFKPLRQLSHSYKVPWLSVPGLPATPVPGTILLERGSSSGGYLVRSTDWGRSWASVLDRPVVQVQFVNRATGFAIASRGASAVSTTLFRTSDAGDHWAALNP